MRLWIIYITGNFNWLKYLSAELFLSIYKYEYICSIDCRSMEKIDVEVIEYCG